MYSKRTGTKAAEFEDQIDRETRKERIMKLIDVQAQITLEKNEARVGQETTILVEGTSKRGGGVTGRTPEGFTVNLPEDLQKGEFANIRITSAKRTTIMGEQI